MRLLSAVLGFALRKVGLFVALIAALFLSYLVVQAVVPTVSEAVAERDRLERVTEERAELQADLEDLRRRAAEERSTVIASLTTSIAAEVEAGRRNVSEKQAEVQRLRDREDEVCGFWEKLGSLVLPGDACDAAERAVETADAALDTLEENLDRAQGQAAILGDPQLSSEEKLERLGSGGRTSTVERQIDNTESELVQKTAEERSLRAARDSGAAWLVDQWARSWPWLVSIALLVLFLPLVLRVVGYFVLMPLVARVHRRIDLAAGSAYGPGTLSTTDAQRTLAVDLADGQVLSARSEHVRPVEGSVRGRLLYDWSSPFISFAAGLYGLSRVTGDGDGASATLATPDSPDAYLMRIDFEDHPGVVVHPKHVVGVIGTPELETRWRWGIQSFATWQVRYIMFAGTGSLIVQGSGDVVATTPRGRSTRIEQNLVMGFDSRLAIGVNRTEVFWPYLWGRTPLVDDEFTGGHQLFWQKSTSDGSSNPIARTFNAFFSALGKLFGF